MKTCNWRRIVHHAAKATCPRIRYPLPTHGREHQYRRTVARSACSFDDIEGSRNLAGDDNLDVGIDAFEQLVLEQLVAALVEHCGIGGGEKVSGTPVKISKDTQYRMSNKCPLYPGYVLQCRTALCCDGIWRSMGSTIRAMPCRKVPNCSSVS